MTRLLTILVAIILPTMILSPNAQAQTVSKNIKTKKAAIYKNKALGWKFAIPASWEEVEVDKKNNQILVLQKDKKKNLFKASLHPTPKADDNTIKNYIGFLKRNIEANVNQIDLTTTFKDGEKTVEGKKFQYLDYVVTDGQGQVVGLYNSYYRLVDGKIFEVTINSEDKKIQNEIVAAWTKSVKSMKK
ncbi:MAG: hypothetical protein R2800_15050 [Flavipsychrobacter sp.]